MDDNNAQDNHNPPSQRNKISRTVGGSKKRQLTRAGALAAAGPLGVAALEGSIAVKNALGRNPSQDTSSQDTNQPSTLSSDTSQENSENKSELETNQTTSTENQDSNSTQKTTLGDDARKLGKIAAKTAQYATPAGLAYMGIQALRNRGKDQQQTTDGQNEAEIKDQGSVQEHPAENAQQTTNTEEQTTLGDDARKLGKIAAKTAQYATPAGLAYTGIKRMRSGIRSNYGNSNASDSPTFSAPSKQTSSSQNGAGSFKKGFTSASGKVFLYGPGGFILGRIAPRLKERIFARQEVEKIEKDARENASKKTTSGKKPSENLKKNTQKIFKGMFYATPVGLTYYFGKKYLPASVKNQIKKFLLSRLQKNNDKNKTTQQKPSTKKKNAKQYQKEWNEQTLARAILRGYNPKALFDKVRDMKVWQTRAWKYGKYALLGPAAAGGIDAYRHSTGSHENINRQSNQTNTTGGSKSSSTRAWQGYNREGSSGPVWNRFVSQKFSTLNQKLGSKLGGKASKNAANTLAKNAGKKLAGQAVKQLQEKLVTSVLANPPVLIGIGVVFLVFLCVAGIMIIIASISGGGGSGDIGGFAGGGAPGGPPINTNPIPGFTIDKTVDKTQSTFPDPITYTITYSYYPPAGATIQLSNITIYDKLPVNTSFSSASGSGKYDSTTNTVSWDLSDSSNTSPLTLVISPTQDKIIITNSAYATAASSGTAPGTTSSTDCNGFYKFTVVDAGVTYANPKGNFADADCNYATNFPQVKDELYNLLKSQDPTNADKWFLEIIPCESSYIPNTYRDHNQEPHTPDPNGAWGLFQIGSTGLNGPYDNGAVPWRNQVNNAVNLLKSQGWGYWGC